MKKYKQGSATIVIIIAVIVLLVAVTGAFLYFKHTDSNTIYNVSDNANPSDAPQSSGVATASSQTSQNCNDYLTSSEVTTALGARVNEPVPSTNDYHFQCQYTDPKTGIPVVTFDIGWDKVTDQYISNYFNLYGSAVVKVSGIGDQAGETSTDVPLNMFFFKNGSMVSMSIYNQNSDANKADMEAVAKIIASRIK